MQNNLPSEDLDISFTKKEGNTLSYTTKIPANNEILLYLEGKYKDGSIVRVYSYEKQGKYTLITDGIKVSNGYITFTTNGESNYIVTTNELIKEESTITKFFNEIKIYLIIGIIALIIIFILISKINKKRKIKESNEPLY